MDAGSRSAQGRALLPLNEAEADHCLAMMAGHAPLLAVSGGSDSMALMGLAAGWARRNGAILHVAVVDHGLRDGSADEATFVMAEAARLAVPCAVLPWIGNKPPTGVQQAARNARYALLASHARACGADVIVTAHTLDDQAETLLMRLAAGSGPAGMAGMRATTERHGMMHLRPLLTVPKDRLIATCRALGWRWVEDPSNRNAAFSRVRWRGLMPMLAREGLTVERLGVFARRMAENEAAMQRMVSTLLDRAGVSRHAERWELDARVLFGEPDALVVRVLAALLNAPEDERDGNRDDHGPRLARIESCVLSMRAAREAGRAMTRTLGGRVLTLTRGGQLASLPEPPRRRGCVNPVRRASLGNRLPEN